MIKEWTFDGGKNSFTYEDDLFGDGDSGKYARGTYKEESGRDGALFIRLGGQDDKDVEDLSGGWKKTFKLEEEGVAEITVRFKLTANANLEEDEFGAVRLALDGEAHGVDGKNYLAKLSGDGEGGSQMSTGWQEATISLGTLEAGKHELDIGGFMNAKTSKTEKVKILIDEISLDVDPEGVELDKFEAEVLELTNDFREENGLDPLAANAALTAAAEGWSKEMAQGDFFEHSDTPEIVEEEGYDWQSLGENIAAGYPTPEEVVEGWINSEGHRENLLSEKFTEIGVGYYFRDNDGGDAPFGHYWTQVFGTPDDLV
ncbi:CAP domain-containing protein [Amaricoccus macauensis]|uniref:CAP domain-containing protein n=1 Tax=Amaricoccus macauensis TaxID=57001 RepID=UPI003C7D9BE8